MMRKGRGGGDRVGRLISCVAWFCGCFMLGVGSVVT